MENGSNKTNTTLFGRARRLEFAEKIGYIIAIIGAAITMFIVLKEPIDLSEKNTKFEYLREYMEASGYSCSMVDKIGGHCYIENDIGTYDFVRLESGFEYIISTEGYNLNIRLSSDKGDYIKFKTSSNALTGYKSKNYTCTWKDTENGIIGELDKCIDEDGDELDSNVYLSVISKTMYELNNIIDSSGYYKSELLQNHEWVKK